MIKLENTEVFGWEATVRGMRNPMNSWSKSDTGWNQLTYEEMCETEPLGIEQLDESTYNVLTLGENDLRLMKQLRKAGHDHSKYLRMINVTVDIVAPLYWWKEFDTYKIGTVRNSCSTMHKIQAKEFTLDDFSCEHLFSNKLGLPDAFSIVGDDGITHYAPKDILELWVIPSLNTCRYLYNQTKDKKYWWQMIQLLPGSYNQRATVQLNYEVLNNMYRSRKNHKLDEWHTFCDWIKTLPYANELIVGDDD